MFSTSLSFVLLSFLMQGSWARNIALSLNLSFDLSQEHRASVSADMLRSCMKETEVAMSELNRFRFSDVSNDQDLMDGIVESSSGDDGTHASYNQDQTKNQDYDTNTSPMIYNERNDESLQCFAYCLYDKLGLTKDGVYVEQDIFRKLYFLQERERMEIKECTNLESNNKCETAYRKYLCYNRIKTVEAERRIRDILEYGSNDNDDLGLIDGNDEDKNCDVAGNCGENNNIPHDDSDSDPKLNEIERT